MSDYPGLDKYGRKRTPYAVDCRGFFDVPGSVHGLVYLTDEDYDHQMDRPNSTWRCPLCNGDANWDDDNYEEMTKSFEYDA